MNQTRGGNLQEAETTRKLKSIRGVIRVRSWKTNGQTRRAWQGDFGVVNGKRLMQSFTSKDAARNWLWEQTLLHQRQGSAGFQLTEDQRLDAVKALGVLAGLGCTLAESATYYRTHKAPAIRKTVSEVVDEYKADAIACNLRPTSIRSLTTHLDPFKATYGDRLITEITRHDAVAWIQSILRSPITKAHYRRIAHGMFAFAIEREYVSENPFASKGRRRKHHEDEKLPDFMHVTDVTTILRTAERNEPSMIPALAVGFFSGLRTAELRGLDWKDIDLENRRIRVMPEVAKKRRARFVQIEDNLLKWLAPCRQQSGLVAPTGEKWRSRLDAIREDAKVKWTHNAMRHSFASYHCAKYDDPAKTASELGHRGDMQMLFEHYRGLATREDGKAYFDICPVVKKGVIQVDFQKVS